MSLTSLFGKPLKGSTLVNTSSSSPDQLTSIILNQLTDTNGRQSNKSVSNEGTNENGSNKVSRTGTNTPRKEINSRTASIVCDSVGCFESKSKQKQGEKHLSNSLAASASFCLLSQQAHMKTKSHMAQELFSPTYGSSFYPFVPSSLASASASVSASPSNGNSLSFISPWLCPSNAASTHVSPSTLTSLTGPYSLLAAFYQQQHNQQQTAHSTQDTMNNVKNNTDMSHRNLPLQHWLGQRIIGNNNLGDSNQLPCITMSQLLRRPMVTMSLNGNTSTSILSGLSNSLTNLSKISTGGPSNGVIAPLSHGNIVNGKTNYNSLATSPDPVEEGVSVMTSQPERAICPLSVNSIADTSSKNPRILSPILDPLSSLFLGPESIAANVTSGPSTPTAVYSSPMETSLFSAAKLHMYLQQQHKQQRTLNAISQQFKYPPFTTVTSTSGTL